MKQLWRIDWKAKGYPFCGVYVISTDSLNPCKIGVSVNAGKRLASLQTAHWRFLQVSQYRWCANVSDATKVERQAHAILRDGGKELLGEWFDVRPAQAVEAMEWAALTLGIELRSDFPDHRVESICRTIAENLNHNSTEYRQQADAEAEYAPWVD